MKRAKKRQPKKFRKSPVLNFDNFKWCVANDFQVYLKPAYNNGPYKIAVRKRGITTQGKDYVFIDGIKIVSKETLSEKTFRTIDDATEHVNYVYDYLRKKYGEQ